MTDLAFDCQKRQKVGKEETKKIRNMGKVPAIIFGGKEEPVSISLDYKEFFPVLRKIAFKTTVYTLMVEGVKHEVLIKDVQFDVVSGKLQHVDFLRIEENTMIKINVPIVLQNQEKSRGIKLGGIINLVANSIEIKCKPADIIHKLVIDLTELNINDAVKINDLHLPSSAEVDYPENFTVLNIAPPNTKDSNDYGTQDGSDTSTPSSDTSKA